MTWNAETNIRGPIGPMGPPGEVPEAPIDGLIYGRKDAGWEEVTEGSGGGASVTISDTPPVSPTSGNLWWESDTGILYIYYDDGSSAQWVAISGGGGGGSPPGSLAPLMDGTASPGVALPYSREDHRHPSDTSKASASYVDTQDALKVAKSGDTMTGNLVAPSVWVGDAADFVPVVPTKMQIIDSDAHSMFVLGQSGGNHFEFLWEYNATPSAAIMRAATFGYNNPMAFDASAIHLNGSSGGSVTAPTPAAGDSSTKVATTAFVRNSVVGRNVLINGGFLVCQRNPQTGTATVDNAYWADRWRYVGEAAGVTYGKEPVGAIPGTTRSAVIQFQTANIKGGAFQVIEGVNCLHMRERTVVLSALMAVSDTRIGNMKMGILEWTGTADATSADPIASWGADGVTPTLATNWAFKNTPTNLNVTTASALFQVSATLGNTFNNLAVLIWNDDKVFTAADFFRLGNVQLEIGAVASPFEVLDVQQVIAQCQRYYRTSYDFTQGHIPGSITTGGNSGGVGYQAFGTGGEAAPSVTYSVPMRAVPSAIGIYSPTTGAGGARRNLSTSTDETMVGFNMSCAVSHYGSSAPHVVNNIYSYHYALSAEI